MIYQFVGGLSDPASKLIEDYSHGPFSHVDCVIPTPSGEMLLGARSDSVGGKPPGVQIRPPGYVAYPLIKRVHIPCTAEQNEKWLAFLLAQVGKPYDTVDLLADFAADRDWRNPNAWWCSELGAAAGEESTFFPHPIGLGVNHVSPVRWYCVSSPWGTVA